MSKLNSNERVLILLFLFLVFGIRAGAEEQLLQKGKGPITITSETLSADSKAHKAVFEGKVVAKSDEMTMYSDKMTVLYSEQGGVNQIEALGNVRLIKGARVITSGKAQYFKPEEKVVFTEEPRITEGKTIITGSRITYLMNEDKTSVENSKVFMETK